jgi:hypothetical protein
MSTNGDMIIFAGRKMIHLKAQTHASKTKKFTCNLTSNQQNYAVQTLSDSSLCKQLQIRVLIKQKKKKQNVITLQAYHFLVVLQKKNFFNL